MARADYEGPMATTFDIGRGLTEEATTTWQVTLAPYLTAGGPPILDLGAGTGRFAALLAGWAAAPVVGVEPAWAMLGQAKSKAAAQSVWLVKGRAEAIPLADHCVQAAFLSNVVHHFDSVADAARELARVTVPGGHVLFRGGLGGALAMVRTEFSLYRWFPDAARFAATFPTRADVEDAFASAGFVTAVATTVEQVTATSHREFYERMRLRSDSTLASLTDDAFEEGLDALGAAAAAEVEPLPVVDHVNFLVFRLACS